MRQFLQLHPSDNVWSFDALNVSRKAAKAAMLRWALRFHVRPDVLKRITSSFLPISQCHFNGPLARATLNLPIVFNSTYTYVYYTQLIRRASPFFYIFLIFYIIIRPRLSLHLPSFDTNEFTPSRVYLGVKPVFDITKSLTTKSSLFFWYEFKS